MIGKQMLSHRQVALMIAIILVAGGLISLMKSAMEVGSMDAWFSEIWGMIYGFLIAYVFYYLSMHFPGKNLFEIVFEVAGKWGGGLINLIFIGHFWMVTIRDVSVFADFMSTTLLVKTPQEIIILLFMLVVIYYAKSSVEVTARVIDLLFPLFLLIMLILPLSLSNEISFERAQPVLGHGVFPVLWTNMLTVGWYGDVVVIGAFLHTVANSKQLYAALRHGIVLAGLCLTMLIFLCITVLGATEGGRTMYPSYVLVEQVHVTDFLDRLELIMFSVWMPAFVLKVILIFMALQTAVASFSRKSNTALYTKQLGWFILLTSILAFKSISEAFNFGNYSACVIILGYQVPILPLLLFLGWRKSKKKRNELPDHQESRRDEKHKQGKGRRTGFMARVQGMKVKTWMWITNALCLLCIGFVVAGAFLGDDAVLFGSIGAAGYSACLLLAIGTSFMELWRANQDDQRKKSAKKKQPKEAKESA